MAPKMLLLLLAAVLLGGGATPAAAFDEPYVFPPTAPEAYPMERSTYRSFRELVALLASNTSLVDPTGTVPPGAIPPPTPLTCGRRVPGTAHTVRCEAGPPLGGYVLEPPRPATASIVFLHGYTDTPYIYGTFFASALASAPALFASVRVAVPLAPIYAAQPIAGAAPVDFYAWFDAASVLSTTVPALLNGTDVAAVMAAFRADTATADRLGLFLSTRRIEAVVARERGAVRNGGARDGGRVLLAGHSLGAAMATHVALVSRSRLDGVVPLQGFLPGAPTLLASNETYDRGARGYDVEMVAGADDLIVPPLVVDASARLVRGLLAGLATVKYTALAGVTHTNFFLPGPSFDAVVGVLRRYLEA